MRHPSTQCPRATSVALAATRNPMQTESVEIYSDAINAAGMRHPGRKYPGVLVQGETLYALCQAADFVCLRTASSKLDQEISDELNDLRNKLWSFLTHYKSVLEQHHIPVPFSESPRS